MVHHSLTSSTKQNQLQISFRSIYLPMCSNPLRLPAKLCCPHTSNHGVSFNKNYQLIILLTASGTNLA